MEKLCNAKPACSGPDAAAAGNSRRSSSIATTRGQYWPVIAHPFRRSIRARFQLILVIAFAGIALMAGIATIASSLILNSFERNISEMAGEIGPLHRLEVLLREAEQLAGLHVIHADTSTLSRFQQVAKEVDSQFRTLSQHATRRRANAHTDDFEWLWSAQEMWKEAQKDTLAAPESRKVLADIADSQAHARALFTAAYLLVSDFHRHAMAEMQTQLMVGKTHARRTRYAIFAGILFGFGLLALVALVVSRSILEPIGQLRAASERFKNKELSHRVRLRNMDDELGQLAKAFNSAAASLHNLYRQLEQRSTHDGLTGLLNRAAFDERLFGENKGSDRHKRPLSLLMVDIDFFKRVNDRYGHQTGDYVLQSIARLLDQATRPSDVVARYGGEEFAVILPETTETKAKAMAERLRKFIESTTLECVTCEEVNITVSVGCATRRPHTLSPEELVKAADEALYQAKEAGRNRVISASNLKLTKKPTRRQSTAA